MIEYIGMVIINDYEYHIEQEKDKIYYGSMCNVGLLRHGHIAYDNDFSLDENLQTLIEYIEENEKEDMI
jgi:hypothetical protein